ncbi:type IV pilin protein, partial [Stutzerimonas stutzeri]|uniref:type IV pilin protein n=1 Tax=Stutzerimonas stutzeri TaxID=316 RepID=UPI003132EA85
MRRFCSAKMLGGLFFKISKTPNQNSYKTSIRKARGLTLIELITTVAIIGLLSAIAIPKLLEYRTKSNDMTALSDTRNSNRAL